MARAEPAARPWPLLALAGACALLAWVYAPGVAGPAVFDDLVVTDVIDEASSSWAAALHALGSDRSGPLGRPVAIATFLLEERFLGDGLGVSKAVNIALHCINLLLVVWLFRRLLRHPGGAPRGVTWAALLAGAAWAFAPLHVSTTLYTVQRMAMLSCSFSLLTLLLYDYWRAGSARGARDSAFLGAMLVTTALAVLSKENALVLPALVLLLELGWYRFADERGEFSRQRCRRWVVAAALLALGGLVFLVIEWARFTAAYAERDFTLPERLLAEGAILWDYLRQLLWPEVERLGLYHDDAGLRFLGDGSLRGWLLLLSWPLVALLPVLCFAHPLLARLGVCLALYLCAHATESTVVPLELYFEHRNYLPSVFVYLAFATLLARLFTVLPQVLPPVVALLSLALLWPLAQTSVQVQLWSSEPLWRMAQLRGHPRSFRANHDMAIELASHGALPGALEYSQRAHALRDERPLDFVLRNVLLDCLAGGTGDTVAQLHTIDDAELVELHKLRMLVALVEARRCPQLPAEELAGQLQRLFLDAPAAAGAHPVSYFLLALLENALGDEAQALRYTQRHLALSPQSVEVLLMQLHLALGTGDEEVAAATRDALARLDERGILTAGQRATLALYRE